MTDDEPKERRREMTVREMASLGGKTAAANSTPEQRRAKASRAGKASAKKRWGTPIDAGGEAAKA